MERVEDSSAKVRKEALTQLEKYSFDETPQEILRATGDCDEQVRRQSLRMLRRMGHSVEEPASIELGRTYISQQKSDKARAVFEAVLAEEPENSEARVEMAELAISKGDRSEARDHILAGLNADEKNGALLSLAARVAHDENKISTEVSYLEKLLDIDKRNWKVKRRLAMALYEGKRYTECSRLFDEVLEHRFDDVEVHYKLGVALEKTDNEKAARSEYQWVTENDPFHLQARIALAELLEKNEDHAAALEEFVRLAEQNPENREILLKVARAARKAGDLDIAETAYSELVKSDPARYEVHLPLAQIKLERSHFQKAWNHIERFLEVEENNIEALLIKCDILEKRGQLNQALEICFHIHAINSETKGLLLKIGKLHKANGQIEQALTCFRNHLEEDPFDIDTMIILAEADEDKRMYSEAIAKYSKAMKISGDDVRAPMALARLYSSLGDFREAITFAESASEITGECYELSIFKAELYMKTGSTDKAKDELLSAVQIMDDLPAAHRLLGTIYAMEESHTRVLYHLNKLPLSYSDETSYCRELGTSYLALGHTSKAREWLEAAHRLDHQAVDVLTSLGELELAEGEYGRAMSFGREIMALEENNSDGFRITGLALYHREAWEDSEELLRKALVTNPSNDQVRETLAQVRYNLKNYQGAIDLYPELNLLPTADFEKRILKARCYFAQGNLTKASDAVEEALEQCPYDTVALSLKAAICKGNNDLLLAETALNRAIKSNPSIYSLYRERGEILFLRKCVDRARMDLLTALEGNGNDTETLVTLGNVEIKSGRISKGLEYLDRAVAIRPTLAQAHYLRAEAYEAMNDSASAIESLENVAHLDPENENCLLELGRKYLLSGDSEKAREHLEKYLQISDTRLPALTALADIHEEAGNNSEARFYLREILRSECASRNVYLRLAELLFEEHRTDEGWDLLKEACGNYPGIYSELGHRAMKEHKLSLAHDLLKRAVSSNGSDFESLLALAKVYFLKKDMKAAQSAVSKLISSYPDFARAHYQMALINLHSGNIDEAKENLRMTVACDDGNSEGWLKLAQVHLDSNSPESAIEAANGALAAGADKLEALRVLARAFRLSGKISEATECLVELAATDPVDEELFALGQGYYETNRPDDALRTMRKLAANSELTLEMKMFLGKLLFEAREYAEAVPYLRTGLETNNVDLCRCYLKALMEMGNTRTAAVAVKKLLEISKNDEEALMAAGELSIKAKNYQGAEKAFKLAALHHENCTQATVELAKLYLEQGRVREALKSVRLVVEKAPNHLPSLSLMADLYERLNMFEKARHTLERIISQPEGDTPAVRLTLSKMYRKTGETKLAEETLATLENTIEAGSIAMRERLELTFADGSYREALELYKNYRRRYPEEAEMPEMAGICYAKLGMTAKATAQLNQMLSRKLPATELTCELAGQYAREGRVLEGERLISQSLESDPSSKALWMKLTNMQMKRRSFNEAEQSVQNLLVFCPDDKDGQLLLGTIYEQCKKYDLMRQTYASLAADNPYFANAHLGLGRAQLLTGMVEEARDSFLKTLSIDKSCAEAHMGLADALRQTGDREGAIKAYREVLKVDGRNSKALYELGTTYKMVQKRELAIFHLEKLIETAPANSHYAGLARKLLNENRGMLIN